MQIMNSDSLRREVLQELRALSRADESMNESAAAVLGIHPTDMSAGEVLDRLGPMTIGELARAVGVSPGAATALVDRLEQAGLAARRQDPDNRRRVLIQPSKKALARAGAVFGPLIQRTAALLEGYNDKELLLIRDFLRGARGLIVDHTETLQRREGH